MKLNSPWKALLWEEMCVAVAVVATILLTVFIICSFYLLHYLFFYGYYPLRFLSFDGYYAICLFFSVLTSFLLLLYNTNLGQLKSGFSRRILQLPVPTYLPVLISLGTRLLLLLAQTVIVRFVFFTFVIRKPLEFSSIFEFFSVYRKAINDIYLANGHTFSSVILMDGFIYLTFQTVSWLLDLSTPFTWVVFIYTSVLVAFGYTVDATFYNLTLTRAVYSFISAHQIITLVLLFIICYFINLQIVKGIRHNLLSSYKQTGFSLMFRPRPKQREESPLLFERFPNRYIAQLWFEIKQNRGFVLPKWTFLLWILGVVILIASDMYLFGYFPRVNSFHVWVTFPQLALLVSGIVWYLRIARPVYKETSHKTDLSSLLPTTNIERINSYTLYFSINLLLAMVLIWIIQFTGLYVGYRIHLSGNFEAIRSVLTVNAADFDRFYPNYIWDIVFFAAGWVVFTGGLVWLLVSYPGYVIFLIALVPILITDYSNFQLLPHIRNTIYNTADNIIQWLNFVFLCIINLLPGWSKDIPGSIACGGAQTSFYLILLITYLYIAICCYFVFMSIVYMFLAIYNRIIKPKVILLLLAILVLVFICLFPYWYAQDLQPTVLYPTLLFLTFLISMYWLRLVIKSYGLSLRKPVRLYCSCISSPYEIPTYQILLSHIFIIIIALLLLGVRFHSAHNHERITAYLKEKNLPTTLYEFKNMGKNVPDEENLALKYLELQKIYKLSQTSIEPQVPRCIRYPEKGKQISEEELRLIEEIRMAYKKFASYINELNIPKKCIALPGLYNFSENLQYDEPFPEIYYKSLKTYYDTCGKYFTQSLKDISKLNLTKSCYGKNIFKKEYMLDFSYYNAIERIETLSQILISEGLLYAIDENYPEMLESFRANLTLYKSFQNEYRYSLNEYSFECFYKTMYVIGWILNHKVLPEEVRIELANLIEQYSPGTGSDAPLYKGLLNTTITIVDKYSTPNGFIEEYFTKHWRPWDPISQFVESFHRGRIFEVWFSFIDLLIPRSLAQTEEMLNYFVLSEYFDKILNEERIGIKDLVKYHNYFYNIFNWILGKHFTRTSPDFYASYLDKSFIEQLFYVDNDFLNITYYTNSDLKSFANQELWKYASIKNFQTCFAIEQFLATQQRLPEDLLELVPIYISSIPLDTFSPNKTITYKKTEDGGYKVYSVGLNMVNNDGAMPEQYKSNPHEYMDYYIYSVGDYVLPISSLEKRQQPDVSNEVIPECIRKEMEEE